MLPTLSLIPVYVMTFVYMLVNEVSDVVTKNTDFIKTVNFVPKNESLKLIVDVIDEPMPQRQFKNTQFDSQISMLKWQLKKNLETLLFLGELETRYKTNNARPNLIEECQTLKIEVQLTTIELTSKLSVYKTLNAI